MLNFTLLFKVNQLQEQVGYISGFQQDISYRVEGQAGEVYNALEEFINEQSWISRISMQIDNKKIKDSEAIATFNWQVKELQNNSKVEFHYSLGDGEEYTSLPADEVQNGLFQVKLPFEFEK